MNLPRAAGVAAAVIANGFVVAPPLQAADAVVSSAPAPRPPGRPPVSLTMSACDGTSEADVRRLLAIELHTELAEPAPGRVTNVNVRCNGDVAELVVEDPLTSKSLSRRIDLAGTAENARGRFLALAATELVTASWLELEANPTRNSVTESVREGAAPPRREAPAGHGQLGLGPLVRVIPRSPHISVGAAATYMRDSVRRFGILVDAAGEVGNSDLDVGSVRTGSASLGFVLYGWWGAGALTTRVGAGGRGGVARAVGRSERPGVSGETFTAPWGGPLVYAGLAFDLGGRTVLALDGEAGWVLAEVAALSQSGTGAELAGPWLGLRVSLGLKL